MSTAVASMLVFAACKNNQTTGINGANTDTTGLAQFQQWKAMNAQTNQAIAKKQSSRKSSSALKTGSLNSSTTNAAKVEKKKGWSKSAKYAVIGGAGGAVMGAIINKKNPVKGAVIGGVVGGGGGYVLGRSQDKKDGRIN